MFEILKDEVKNPEKVAKFQMHVKQGMGGDFQPKDHVPFRRPHDSEGGFRGESGRSDKCELHLSTDTLVSSHRPF